MIFKIEKYKELTSTNDTAKIKAASGVPEGTVVLAEHQIGGRGRAGHTFYSPNGGIYMSLVLRPRFSDFTLITPAAAVAVCKTAEKLGFDCRIKWVNDVYRGDKKICGILTESNIKDGWAVLGIGLNTNKLDENAPPVAGWLYDEKVDNEKIVELLLNEIDNIYKILPDKSFIGYYREKNYLIGKEFLINGEEYSYKGINDDFSLAVTDKSGAEKRFICGDVSVKFK